MGDNDDGDDATASLDSYRCLECDEDDGMGDEIMKYLGLHNYEEETWHNIEYSIYASRIFLDRLAYHRLNIYSVVYSNGYSSFLSILFDSFYPSIHSIPSIH